MGKKSNKSSRNVLALPNESFWPALEESETEISLLEELKQTLEVAKTIHPQFKWSEVRKMNKEQKAKHVEEFYKNLSPEEREYHEKAKQLKKDLAIGFNEVSRGLENKKLACCLVHGQAKPKIIITHVIQLAQSRRVPILIVNDLKQSMKESLGYSSLAVGFSKEITTNEKHEFHQLCQRIITLSKRFSEDLEEPAETAHEAEQKTEGSEYKKNADINFTQMMIDCSSLHLYRTSSDYRVFHPPDDESVSVKAGGMDVTEEKSTPVTTTDDNPVPNKKPKFIEPTILRVQSNPNKLRKNKNKKKK